MIKLNRTELDEAFVESEMISQLYESGRKEDKKLLRIECNFVFIVYALKPK